MEQPEFRAEIGEPEQELRNFFEARVKPFRELGQSAKAAQYERAWEIALSFLREVLQRGEEHAP